MVVVQFLDLLVSLWYALIRYTKMRYRQRQELLLVSYSMSEFELEV